METTVKTDNEIYLEKLLAKHGLGVYGGKVRRILFLLFLTCYKIFRKKFFQIRFLFSKDNFLPRGQKGKLKILIHINGGLGDALLARPLLQKLRTVLPPSKALIFLACRNKDIFETFFYPQGLADFYVNRGYFNFNYDFVASGCAYLEYEKADTKKIKKIAPNFLHILDIGLKRQKDLSFYIKFDPYSDILLAKYFLSLGLKRVDTLPFFAGFEGPLKKLPFKVKNENILKKFNLKGQKYITVHYENGEKHFSNFEPTRPWPRKNWEYFIKLFKQKYPDILIVQLGGNVALKGAQVCLCSKTSLLETSAILQGSLLHIDGEGALVHICAVLDKRALVMYGPNLAIFLGYPQNKNLQSNNCSNCVWIKKNWRSCCALGHKRPLCMESFTPEVILGEVSKLL